MNKKILLIVLTIIQITFFASTTYAINVINSQNVTTSCDQASVDAHYYIPNGSDSIDIYPQDLISNNNVPIFIRNGETSVTLWNNGTGNMQCNGAWTRYSNALPVESGTRFLAVGTDVCSLHKVSKTDSNLSSSQIVFNIAYKEEVGLGSGNSYYYYFKEGDSTQYEFSDQTRRVWSDIYYHGNECFNVYTHWCGDGIVDSDYGEDCDGSAGCSSTCSSGGGGQDPCITGGVTGAQTTSISETTPDLCRAGEVVSGFEAHINGSTTNYLWMCDGRSGGSCVASYTNGGGGGGSCISGGVTGTQTSSISETTPNLCRSGETVGNFSTTVSGLTSNYTWECNGDSGGSCNASYTSGGSGRSGTYCGDGIVQRPSREEIDVDYSCITGNDAITGDPIYGTCTRIDIVEVMEECDFGAETDWLFCNSDCTYIDVTNPSQCPSGNCDITIPNGGSMSFGPVDNVIIGAGMNPYIDHSLGKPYIKNTSDYDLYFDELCVVDKVGTTLLGSSTCESAGIIRSGTTKYFSTTPNFVGSEVTTGNYSDNTLITTIKHDGVRYDDGYFIGELDVRVAKSSVATTGGGTSYLADTSSISNISDVANNGDLNPDVNKNFVGVGISSGDVSSYSNEIDDTTNISTVESEGDVYEENIKEVTDISGTAMGTTSLLSDFDNYNGISNVYIIKSKNFSINSDIFSGITGARTYIIENGDLLINSDINFTDNIGFVVKGGNIEIDKSVTNMNGTYITIEKDSSGGSFIGIGGNTTNVLIVNGSLYGDINNLVSTRTYVKQNSSSQIDVGTIVSFGSSLFRKPAPLLSTFINEYLTAEKIAK